MSTPTGKDSAPSPTVISHSPAERGQVFVKLPPKVMSKNCVTTVKIMTWESYKVHKGVMG